MKISRPRATQLSQMDIDVDLAMGAHDITLGAGQTVDGIDVSLITGYVHDGTLVIDGGVAPSPNPSAWTDLNLSAYVGANRAVVFLKVTLTGAAGEEIAIRPNGDTDDYFDVANGGCAISEARGNNPVIICCETDNAGIIEWYCETAASDVDITLLGYVN